MIIYLLVFCASFLFYYFLFYLLCNYRFSTKPPAVPKKIQINELKPPPKDKCHKPGKKRSKGIPKRYVVAYLNNDAKDGGIKEK